MLQRIKIILKFLLSITTILNISLIILSILMIRCNTFVRNQYKLQFSGTSVAIYSVPKSSMSQYLPKELMENIESFSSASELNEVLDSIYIKQNIFSSEDWSKILPKYILDEVKIAFERNEFTDLQVESNYGFLCLVKMDDPLSPNTKILRTSFYIYGTKEGFLIILKDINQNISFPTQYTFEDWVLFKPSRIFPILKPQIWLKGKPENLKMFQTRDDSKPQVYPNIILYKGTQFRDLPFVWKTPGESDEVDLKNWESVPEKLRSLKQMREEGLITEEEFNRKKKELLKEY